MTLPPFPAVPEPKWWDHPALWAFALYVLLWIVAFRGC